MTFVRKIAWRGLTACATARRDFAHAVGGAARRCALYAFVTQYG
jgi:hypothetical protein